MDALAGTHFQQRQDVDSQQLPHPPATGAETSLLGSKPRPGFLTPILLTQPHALHPPSWSSPKLPDRGAVLLFTMTASFCPSDRHGTRLSTEIKTERPYSFREGADGPAARSADLCAHGVGGGRLGPAELSHLSVHRPTLACGHGRVTRLL